jgi:hypothetical protein
MQESVIPGIVSNKNMSRVEMTMMINNIKRMFVGNKIVGSEEMSERMAEMRYFEAREAIVEASRDLA